MMEKPEPTPDVITWVYEEGDFVPSAKLVGDHRFSIVSDYIGRPVQAYDDLGQVVWQVDYDIYGELRNLKGERELPLGSWGSMRIRKRGCIIIGSGTILPKRELISVKQQSNFLRICLRYK